jgi:hypothetical protein
MSNDQLPLFKKRGLLFKEKISVYFFVNEEVLNLINQLFNVHCSLFTDKDDPYK